MFNVVAHALEADASQSPDPEKKAYQMSARMSVQYNEYKMKLNRGPPEVNDGGKKMKVWPTLQKLQVRTKVVFNFVLR